MKFLYIPCLHLMHFLFSLQLILVSTSISIEELNTFFDDSSCIEGKLVDMDTGPILMHNDNIIKVLEKEIHNDEVSTTLSSVQTQNVVSQRETKSQFNKSPLQLVNELAQINKIVSKYILTKEEGPPHQRIIDLKLKFGEEIYTNSAQSIKEAKIKLALQVLQNTKYKRPDNIPNKFEEGQEIVVKEPQVLTPTVQLNNIAASLGMKVEYINENGHTISNKELLNEDVSSHNYYSLDSNSKSYIEKLNDSIYHQKNLVSKVGTTNKASLGPFTIRLIVGTRTYIGVGLSIQEARHNAAKLALEYFKSMSLKDAEQCVNEATECNKLNVKSPISLIYETATKKGIHVEFKLIDTKEENGQHVFTTLCSFGDLITKADGSSKKQSKKKAAENMIKELEKVEPFAIISGIEIPNMEKKNNKKNKKKNKKVTRGFMNNLQNEVEDTVFAIYGYFNGDPKANMDTWQNNDETNKDEDTNSLKHKSEFLSLTKSIDVDVKFSSFQEGGLFSTFLTIELDPTYICLGKDVSKEQSEDNASLAALKFIKEIGFDNIIIPLKKNKGKAKIVLPSNKNNLHDVNKF